MSDDESDFINALRAGDRRARERLYDQCFDAVHRFFSNKARNRADVEDLVQRTFLRVFEKTSGFRGDASPCTYVLGFARLLVLEHYRKQARDQRLAERVGEHSVVAHTQVGASTIIGKQQEHRLILEALRRVTLNAQIILELYYWENFKGRELAKFLAIPENTARSRLRVAKAQLARELEAVSDPGGASLKTTVSNLDTWARSIRALIKEPDGEA